MAKIKLDKYNLNIAGECRIAAELLLRGLHASITFGNKKSADLFVFGENRIVATVEVKASQTNKFVTSYYQKYKTQTQLSPDFWVFYSVSPIDQGFGQRFYILTHAEVGKIQADVNCPGESLSYPQLVARVEKGVDNVPQSRLTSFENQWKKILTFCNRPAKSVGKKRTKRK